MSKSASGSRSSSRESVADFEHRANYHGDPDDLDIGDSDAQPVGISVAVWNILAVCECDGLAVSV